jgi:hypothetical protein
MSLNKIVVKIVGLDGTLMGVTHGINKKVFTVNFHVQ